LENVHLLRQGRDLRGLQLQRSPDLIDITDGTLYEFRAAA
jgi:hypothetical protein